MKKRRENADNAAIIKEKRDGEEGHHPGPLPASAYWPGVCHVTSPRPMNSKQGERHRPAGASPAPVDTAPLSLNDVSGAARILPQNASFSSVWHITDYFLLLSTYLG